MAYQTGSSTGPDDLLDKLRSFLLGDGWTVNGYSSLSSMYESWSGLNGAGYRLHVQKTAGDSTVMYFNFRSVNRGVVFEDHYLTATQIGGKYYAEITGIAMNGSTGYNAGNNWDKQPGYMQSSGGSWGCCVSELSLTSIPAYWFFSDGDTVIVAIEYTSGKMQWMAFGLLEKSGSYTGGQFVAASLNGYMPAYQMLYDSSNPGMKFLCRNVSGTSYYYGNAAVYFAADSVTAWRSCGALGSKTETNGWCIEMPGLPSYSAGLSYNSLCTFNNMFIRRAPNHYNALSPGSPIFVLGKRASGDYSLLGYLKSIYMLNVEYYDVDEEEVLGSDTWHNFPLHSKDDPGYKMGFTVLENT